jgi:outer membrane lipoprotein carrier protein
MGFTSAPPRRAPWLALLVSGLSLPSAGAQPATGLAPAAIDALVAQIETFEADFTQTLTDANGTTLDRVRGHLVIARPWRFRWDYIEPAERQIVADGKHVWLYETDLEQVTVRPIDTTLAGTPAMLLSGEGKLTDQFDIRESERRDGIAWVELAPKVTESDFHAVRLGFEDEQLEVMELDDKLGQTTRLEFSDVYTNRPVDAQRFEFEPPPGADVIGSTDP